MKTAAGSKKDAQKGRLRIIIVGQGLAGSSLAWTLHWHGQDVFLTDSGDVSAASRVSAGLMTPVTGKRLVQSEDFQESWAAAKQFYRRVETETGTAFFTEAPILRLFRSESERQQYLKRSGPFDGERVALWEGRLTKDGSTKVGVRISPAGRLNVATYQRATRQFFEGTNSFQKRRVYPEDVEQTEGKIRVQGTDVVADYIVWCTGASTVTPFADIPNNPSRGEILTVRLADYQATEVVHQSIWIAPEANGIQRVGATYDRNDQVSGPTAAGRRQLLEQLQEMVQTEITVSDHTAGVRPGMKDYQPVLGRHPKYDHMLVYNGLGSKGSLKAPLMAEKLVDHLMNKSALPKQVSSRRLKGSGKIAGYRSLTGLAQELVGEVIQPGDLVIDATVGRGFDTCFLSKAVGDTGRVIGLDIQEEAIASTRSRLDAAGLTNVELKRMSHEYLAEIARPESVKAVMFNLGYLPGTDHQVITQPQSTVSALTAAISLLQPGGILSVLCYRGHVGGAEEYRKVKEVLERSKREGVLQQHESTVKKATSPVLFTLERNKFSVLE